MRGISIVLNARTAFGFSTMSRTLKKADGISLANWPTAVVKTPSGKVNLGMVSTSSETSFSESW